jgi:hypothetical protein
MADCKATTENQTAGGPEQSTTTGADSTPPTGSQPAGNLEGAPGTQRCSRCKKYKSLIDFQIVRGGFFGKVCMPCRVDPRRPSTTPPPAPLASGASASMVTAPLLAASAVPSTQVPEQTSSSAATGAGEDDGKHEGRKEEAVEGKDTEVGAATPAMEEPGSIQQQEGITRATAGPPMTSKQGS